MGAIEEIIIASGPVLAVFVLLLLVIIMYAVHFLTKGPATGLALAIMGAVYLAISASRVLANDSSVIGMALVPVFLVGLMQLAYGLIVLHGYWKKEQNTDS
ncbi:MAG: hypothetical protein HY519_04280 [Candidatus Aenigmarchaeota archaeon]|nr:hypothetical protein [Candidatus Aenigmarchaeota archaeon]